MDTFVLQLEADAIDVSVPFFLVSSLLTDLDSVLVLIIVTEECIDTELIFEAHWEGFILVREVNEDVLLTLLGQSHQVLFEFLRLCLLNDLRNHNHSNLELLLLHVNRVVLELNDTQCLEGGVAGAGQLDSW